MSVDWLSAFRELQAERPADDPGNTVREISERLGLSTASVRQNVVRPGVESGRIRCGRRRVRRIDGNWSQVPVYWMEDK